MLGWLKLKKQRLEREKRTTPIMTTEYLTYRSYSISNEESIGTKDTAVTNTSASNVPNNTQSNPHDPSHNNNLTHNNNMPNNISSSILSNCQHHHMHHNSHAHGHSHQHPTYISGSVMGTTTIPS